MKLSNPLARFFSGRDDAEKAGTPEQEFWDWFQKNEASLFNFENHQEQSFNRLAKELHAVNEHLTFEFGPKIDGRRDFVISADGIREAFTAVEALYAAAPELARWKFIKFRPRRSPCDISTGDITVKASGVRIHLERYANNVDLTLYIPEFREEASNSFKTIVYLLLDEAIGEYDVETYVGGISVKHISAAPEETLSLNELPQVFDSAKAKIVH